MSVPNKVYLHTFPPVPHVYSMSPFSVKVESWLRLHGIDYECVYCMQFGPKGQIPFVLVGDEVHRQCRCSGAVRVQWCSLVQWCRCSGAHALCVHCR